MVRQVASGLVIATVLLVNAPAVGERTRTPEEHARGALFAVLSAQSTYRAITGHFETPQCLASTACLRPLGLPPTRILLSPDIAALNEQHGYRFMFYLGPRASLPSSSSSATPLTGFAVVAVPRLVEPGASKAFCADATGQVYVTLGAQVPRVHEGRCLDTNQALGGINMK